MIEVKFFHKMFPLLFLFFSLLNKQKISKSDFLFLFYTDRYMNLSNYAGHTVYRGVEAVVVISIMDVPRSQVAHRRRKSIDSVALHIFTHENEKYCLLRRNAYCRSRASITSGIIGDEIDAVGSAVVELSDYWIHESSSQLSSFITLIFHTEATSTKFFICRPYYRSVISMGI